MDKGDKEMVALDGQGDGCTRQTRRWLHKTEKETVALDGQGDGCARRTRR